MDPNTLSTRHRILGPEDPWEEERDAPASFAEMLGHEHHAEAMDAETEFEHEIFAGLVTP